MYFDHLSLDGKTDQNKFSYNTALMIRAACRFYGVTGEASYLKEAVRLAKASAARWLRPDGSADDVGYFGHLLLEAMLEYGELANDPHWADLAVRMCDYL